MTDHDPLCELAGDHSRDECCGNLAKARADERAEIEMGGIGDVIHADRRRQRAELCAEVKALHSQARDWGKDGHVILWVNRDDVLALLDGSDA